MIQPVNYTDAKSDFPVRFDPKEWLVQRKWDGTRIITHIDDDGNIKMFGKRYLTEYTDDPKFRRVVEDIKSLELVNTILDGEFLFMNSSRNLEEFFSARVLPSSVSHLTPMYMPFDVLQLNGNNVSALSQLNRSTLLNEIIKPTDYLFVPETHLDHDEFNNIYKSIISSGGEGVIYKKKSASYEGGTRKNWIKLKKLQSEDCIVLGYTTGTGKRAPTFGSLILGQYDGGVIHHVGNASGFSEADSATLWRLMNAMPPHQYAIKLSNAKRWIKPQLVVEVQFMERTTAGMLRHPRFTRFRLDKPARDCTFIQSTGNKTLDQYL